MAGEILAPAGSLEALQAAVRSGANAVYLGGKAFNARRNASNFDDGELKSAVEYCHARNVKVYLTLNTLVGDNEMQTAYDAIKYTEKKNKEKAEPKQPTSKSKKQGVVPDWYTEYEKNLQKENDNEPKVNEEIKQIAKNLFED